MMLRTVSDGSQVHDSITEERIVEVLEEAGDEMRGFCILCGEDAYGCEPDAEKYTCEHCGGPGVYGAEQLLLHTVV